MLLLIDNYDSFTYNLVQYLGELGQDVRVIRNDELSVEQIRKLAQTASENFEASDVLERLDGFATMTRKDLGFLTRQVQPGSISALFHFDRRRNPQGFVETIQEIDYRCNGVCHVSSLAQHLSCRPLLVSHGARLPAG